MLQLKDRVAVVTGASSGIGRATARELALQGCTVVLAARRFDALEETARMCRLAGGRGICFETDVTREQDVVRLAGEALRQAGRIDVWINNAGVTLFSPLEQGPFEAHRRVIETNLYGPIFGARAVLPIFRKQGHGVLINVGSVLSKVGQPFVPAYVISKFGLRGVSEALRAELADEPNIHVCTVFPYAIDTQHFEVSANRIGRRARAMPPAQSPERVARAIVGLARRPRRERHVPRYAQLGLALHALFPDTTDRLLLHSLRRWHFDDGAEPRTYGNLFSPSAKPARSQGERPPQIGSLGFAAWLARELVKIQQSSAQRLLRRWALKARFLIGKPDGEPLSVGLIP